MSKYLCFFLLALTCLACTTRSLERPDVPIVWGMRLNEPADASELSPNLAKLRELVMRSLVIELPLKADSAGLPRITVDAPGEIVGLMGRFKVRLHLAICNTNEEELFPIGRPANPALWFQTLRAEIHRNLEVLETYPPDRVIIGGDMLQVGYAVDEWRNLLAGLRVDFPGILFSVGGRTEFLDSSGLGALSDELCIDYPPMAGEELKAECRVENQHISDLAGKTSKPVFMYRANIIGETPLIQFKNRLRFWPDETQVSGICINTIYPKVPARDDHTYYGLADDADLLSYLQAYRLQTAE